MAIHNSKSRYKILHDFQVKNLHVLQLDGDYEFGSYDNVKAIIDDNYYNYTLNSVKSWIVLENTKNISEDYFKGKTVEFIRNANSSTIAIANTENVEAISA